MHFGENELSPSSIGFSPLNLPHLPTFQRRWVRASTVSYHSFTLDRIRSPGFASTPSDYVALFRLGFPSHLPTFQRRWVRASTVSYHSFTLDRIRSPGFASTPSDYVALFRLGFPSAPLYLTSPLNVTRSIILQKARHHPCGLWPIVSTQFQVIFHSPPGVLFTFPSRYYTLSISKSI